MMRKAQLTLNVFVTTLKLYKLYTGNKAIYL